VSWEFISSRIIKKTRVDHQCVYCGRTIPKGSIDVNNWCGKFDGEFQNHHACHWCDENSDLMSDGDIICDFEPYDIFCDIKDEIEEKYDADIRIEWDGDDDNYLLSVDKYSGEVLHREYLYKQRKAAGGGNMYEPTQEELKAMDKELEQMGKEIMEQIKKIDIRKPIYAKCYDVDKSWHGDVEFLELEVDVINLKPYRDEPHIVATNGERHYKFELYQKQEKSNLEIAEEIFNEIFKEKTNET
jgi:hypothetical protein